MSTERETLATYARGIVLRDRLIGELVEALRIAEGALARDVDRLPATDPTLPGVRAIRNHVARSIRRAGRAKQ